MITIKKAIGRRIVDCHGKWFSVVSDRGDLEKQVFFLMPSNAIDLLPDTDEAILPLAAMLAFVRGEDCKFDGLAVDPLLERNVRAALRQLTQWYPEFSVPTFSGLEEKSTKLESKPDGVLAFLSGGVDSTFSLLRHTCGHSDLPESAIDREVTHAVHVYHTPDPDVDPAKVNLSALEQVAKARSTSFIPIYTNMMTFDRALNDRWSDVGHGAGLATVLHMLAGGASAGIIASSHTFGRLMPWGSSPLLDPLWSSNRMRIVHDGSTYSRVEKTEFIARFPEEIRGLNVCDNRLDDAGYVNCSKCQKCLRTMVTLDLCSRGNTSHFAAFDWSNYNPAQVTTIFLRNDSEKSFIAEIMKAAEDSRPDITVACEKTLAKARILQPVSMMEKHIKKSEFGRRNRAGLINLRNAIYRSAGWASRS